MKHCLILAAVSLSLAACNQTAGAPPIDAGAAPRPVAARPAPRTKAERIAMAEEARVARCTAAAERAQGMAVSSALLGGALDIAGAGTWGRAGWALSSAGGAVANTGAVAAEHEMNVAVARGDC
ncbi:MAG TPA: hypothetical protein VIL65_05565 [Beijerinckiaceae bacterium]|jgi:hypothetical protein